MGMCMWTSCTCKEKKAVRCLLWPSEWKIPRSLHEGKLDAIRNLHAWNRKQVLCILDGTEESWKVDDFYGMQTDRLPELIRAMLPRVYAALDTEGWQWVSHKCQ